MSVGPLNETNARYPKAPMANSLSGLRRLEITYSLLRVLFEKKILSNAQIVAPYVAPRIKLISRRTAMNIGEISPMWLSRFHARLTDISKALAVDQATTSRNAEFFIFKCVEWLSSDC